MVNQGENWVKIATEAYKVSQLRKECERKEKELLEQLKELSKDKDSVGGGYRYFSSDRKGSIDYGMIPALKGLDLEQYRKSPTIVWKLEYTNLEF